MDEQVCGNCVTLPLMQEPGSQRLGESRGGVGPQRRQRSQHPATQILGGVRISAEDDFDQVLIGVENTVNPGAEMTGPDRPPVGGRRCQPWSRRTDDRLPVCQSCQQCRTQRAVHVRHQQHRPGVPGIATRQFD